MKFQLTDGWKRRSEAQDKKQGKRGRFKSSFSRAGIESLRLPRKCAGRRDSGNTSAQRTAGWGEALEV